MTGKLLAVLVALLLTNVVYIATASAMAQAVATENYNNKIFMMISISLFFVQLIFVALGVFISVIIPRIKSITSISLGTVFGFFIISMFGSVIGDQAIRYITPFKYFDTTYIIKHGSYETSFIILTIAIIAVTVTASYLIYYKKDISAA